MSHFCKWVYLWENHMGCFAIQLLAKGNNGGEKANFEQCAWLPERSLTFTCAIEYEASLRHSEEISGERRTAVPDIGARAPVFLCVCMHICSYSFPYLYRSHSIISRMSLLLPFYAPHILHPPLVARWKIVICNYPDEKLNIRLDGGQTTYANRTLYNLCSNLPGKPNHSLCRNQPRLVRTWPMTASFPEFCPLLPNQDQLEKAKPITQDVPLLVALPVASHANGFLSWHSPFFPISFPSLLPAFESQPCANDGGRLPCSSKCWINSLCVFPFGWPLFISTQGTFHSCSCHRGARRSWGVEKAITFLFYCSSLILLGWKIWWQIWLQKSWEVICLINK